MGKTFRYVSDCVTDLACDPPCNLCGDVESACYRYDCVLDEVEGWGEYQFCANCINSGRVKKDDYELGEIEKTVIRNSGDLPRLTAPFHTIPHVMQHVQGIDWPICCGDWCEFIGYPGTREDLKEISANSLYWSRVPWGTEYNPQYELHPEILEEVCLYKCQDCQKRYCILGGS